MTPDARAPQNAWVFRIDATSRGGRDGLADLSRRGCSGGPDILDRPGVVDPATPVVVTAEVVTVVMVILVVRVVLSAQMFMAAPAGLRTMATLTAQEDLTVVLIKVVLVVVAAQMDLLVLVATVVRMIDCPAGPGVRGDPDGPDDPGGSSRLVGPELPKSAQNQSEIV